MKIKSKIFKLARCAETSSLPSSHQLKINVLRGRFYKQVTTNTKAIHLIVKGYMFTFKTMSQPFCLVSAIANSRQSINTNPAKSTAYWNNILIEE
jgi:hypothetical protein